MKTYISLLRGINIGGHKKIKMDSLRENFSSLGYSNIKTYIQSGNILFSSKEEDKTKLEKEISSMILDKYGFDVPVLVLNSEELNEVISNNPFANSTNHNKDFIHITFLSNEVKEFNFTEIDSKKESEDEYKIINKTVYLYLPKGYGNTKIHNNFLEKLLKTQATTRNWKTCLELLEMSK
ncbi:MAG: DUF1697 domain-containing protein [Bacteroidales bacterium]|nr:DUF1697 domain-containing protein [Bacteroidales bacterium]